MTDDIASHQVNENYLIYVRNRLLPRPFTIKNNNSRIWDLPGKG